jgi:alpha-amylase/alpha-mannosidase (GH57 family)
MTKPEIVEALRCAADLCSGAYWRYSIGDATTWLDVSCTEVADSAVQALGRYIAAASEEVKRHDLLEAAQRIEESE